MGRGTRQNDVPPESFARFKFHGGLENILTRRYYATQPSYRFWGTPGVKDAVEAVGIPHTEVDVILANGRSVGFDYRLQDHDLIEVYPVQAELPVSEPIHLSPPIPDPPSFVMDVHLGRLARRLRLLGFDCLYRNDFSDNEIILCALQQERIILTRDLGILKQNRVLQGYLVRADRVDDQLRELLVRYRLATRLKIWSRCTVCNGLLEKVEKSAIEHLLAAKTRRYYQDFHRCAECDRVFWPGSHYENMQNWLEGILAGT